MHKSIYISTSEIHMVSSIRRCIRDLEVRAVAKRRQELWTVENPKFLKLFISSLKVVFI